MKVSLLEPIGVPESTIRELSKPIIERGHEFVYYDTKTTDPKELAKRSEGCEVVMIANNPYPAETVAAAKDLKLLSVAFTGIDHVATDACKERGITISNCAGYSDQTVAELTICMAISAYRKTLQSNAAVRSGGTSAGIGGREIAGKTVGIIGLGKIGMMTAKLFLAFGAKVIAFNRSKKPEAEALGIEYTDLDTLLKTSDIVSLHLPNNKETKGFISAEKIALMKKSAVFINCARGPIVDNAALADALNNDKLSFACIDVYDMEPPIPADYPLMKAKNTFLTPHQAFISEEAMLRRAKIVFENVYAYIDGHPQNVMAL
ncbi:MAG: hydroxyacid dehydrogenase [Clostridia bacterium]|nr:hydroxyacid dehydrogenase [Clostridia bacterium]